MKTPEELGKLLVDGLKNGAKNRHPNPSTLAHEMTLIGSKLGIPASLVSEGSEQEIRDHFKNIQEELTNTVRTRLQEVMDLGTVIYNNEDGSKRDPENAWDSYKTIVQLQVSSRTQVSIFIRLQLVMPKGALFASYAQAARWK